MDFKGTLFDLSTDANSIRSTYILKSISTFAKMSKRGTIASISENISANSLVYLIKEEFIPEESAGWMAEDRVNFSKFCLVGSNRSRDIEV